jgi:hypothetical protein
MNFFDLKQTKSYLDLIHNYITLKISNVGIVTAIGKENTLTLGKVVYVDSAGNKHDFNTNITFSISRLPDLLKINECDDVYYDDSFEELCEGGSFGFAYCLTLGNSLCDVIYEFCSENEVYSKGE